MSDNKASETKKSFTDRLANAAAIGAAIVAAFALIPQDEVMKRLPGFWESFKGILHLSWLRLEEATKRFRPIAYAWATKLWRVIKWWAFLSAALIAFGIEMKTRFGSNFGHVLVAAGVISFVTLGLMLFALSDGIASIMIFKVKLAGGLVGKAVSVVGIDLSETTGLDHEEIGKKAIAIHEKVKLVLAGTIVLCFSLLFTMMFPAWSTLGWSVIFWAMVAVALCCALYLNMQMGKAVKVVFYATIALIIMTFVAFILDRLTGGAIGFSGFQKWLVGRNQSQVITALLVVIPMSLLIASPFMKEKDKKEAFLKGSKYVGIGSFALFCAFLYSGTIGWSKLWGREAPKAVSEFGEKIQNTSISSKSSGTSPKKPETATAPQGTTSNGGRYMAPPNGSPSGDPMPHEEKPAVRTAPKQKAKKPPLPPLKAKEYADEAEALADIDSI